MNRSSTPYNFTVNTTYDGGETPATYTPLSISSDPGNIVYFGNSGDTGDTQICLNSSCISTWPSGGGGSSQSFKFIDVPSGIDPQADSSGDE